MKRCWAEISIINLKNNLNYLKKISDSENIILMVKASAYGHGIELITHVVQEYPEIILGVASFEEALVLREQNIKNRIYIFDGGLSCYTPEKLIFYNLVPMVSTYESCYELISFASKSKLIKKFNYHIKIDTGFVRNGICWEKLLDGEYDKLFLEISNNNNLNLEGLATHFACADKLKENFSELQIKRFKLCLDYLNKFKIKPRIIHIANSAAILKKINITNLQKYTQNFYIRPGIAAYGLYPALTGFEKHKIKPVMSLFSQLVAIKKIGANLGVGYGHSFKTAQESYIGIVAIGYGDGLRRGLSSKIHVLLEGERAPIIGTISMDFCAIDLTNILRSSKKNLIKIGSKVIILGESGLEKISAEDHARVLNTIAYEIVTGVSERVPREIKI